MDERAYYSINGMHIMFSFVVIPFILDFLINDESNKLKRAFEYFERMASSDSADVTEVLEFTVIENLMSNGKTVYDKAKQYMGDNMTECCKRTERSCRSVNKRKQAVNLRRLTACLFYQSIILSTISRCSVAVLRR